jgi:hypothetical protein
MNSSSIQNYFTGRKLLLATMHGKEKVIAPVLTKELGVEVVLTTNLDTDELGTFSGEIERKFSPLETAKLKCEAARRLTGADLILASEGSFGAHPAIPFVTADEEILVLKDYQHGLEIKAKHISLQTNSAAQTFTSWPEAEAFAERVGFPQHALILRHSKTDCLEIHKGVRSLEQLKKSFNYFVNKKGTVYVETDMRAMYNPTRMEVIRQTAEKLVEIIKQVCPCCGTPGFEIKEMIQGLPCELCETPTRSAKAMVRSCNRCGHTTEILYPHQKQKEDPMYCDSCNP